MTGLFAAQRCRNLLYRSNFHAASARSTKSTGPVWARCGHRSKRSIRMVELIVFDEDGPLPTFVLPSRFRGRSPHCRHSLQEQKLVDCELVVCGTLPPFAGAASACAENARVCGNLIGAMQKFSPKRSLKLTLNNRIQKVLTLLAFRPRKMRTRSCFDVDMPIGARQFVLSHPKSRALLQETF